MLVARGSAVAVRGPDALPGRGVVRGQERGDRHAGCEGYRAAGALVPAGEREGPFLEGVYTPCLESRSADGVDGQKK